MDHLTTSENSAPIGIIQLVTNIINGRRLKKILDEESGSRPRGKPKKVKTSNRKANKLWVLSWELTVAALTSLSTRKNQTDSRLLLLPPELRTQIFEYVLGGQTWKIRFDLRFGKTFNQSRYANALALLATCRQIHAETQLLPFRLSLFSALNCVSLHRWLLTIKPFQCTALTNIQVVCNFECTEECCLDGAIFAQQWCFSQLDSLKRIQVIAQVVNVTGHLRRKVAASWVDTLEGTLKLMFKNRTRA
jgi:hypothetical protein